MTRMYESSTRFRAILLILAAQAVLVTAATPNAKRGERVYAQQCDGCHTTDGQPAVGPSVKGLYKKANLRNGRPVNDTSVLDIINKGGNGMRAYQDMLTDAEKADILAYLKTL